MRKYWNLYNLKCYCFPSEGYQHQKPHYFSKTRHHSILKQSVFNTLPRKSRYYRCKIVFSSCSKDLCALESVTPSVITLSTQESLGNNCQTEVLSEHWSLPQTWWMQSVEEHQSLNQESGFERLTSVSTSEYTLSALGASRCVKQTS